MALLATARHTNGLIEGDIRERSKIDHVSYIDVWTPMLNANGQPRGELFGPDKLHMNRRGYQLWTQIIAPHLQLGST